MSGNGIILLEQQFRPLCWTAPVEIESGISVQCATYAWGVQKRKTTKVSWWAPCATNLCNILFTLSTPSSDMHYKLIPPVSSLLLTTSRASCVSLGRHSCWKVPPTFFSRGAFRYNHELPWSHSGSLTTLCESQLSITQHAAETRKCMSAFSVLLLSVIRFCTLVCQK